MSIIQVEFGKKHVGINLLLQGLANGTRSLMAVSFLGGIHLWSDSIIP